MNQEGQASLISSCINNATLRSGSATHLQLLPLQLLPRFAQTVRVASLSRCHAL